MPIPTGLKPCPFVDRVPTDLSEDEWSDVAGQATPNRVAGTELEYRAIRTGAGLLDFSMLPKWEIVGDGALDALNAIFSRDVTALRAGSIAYGVIVDESGMMLDDCTVLVYGPDRVRITGGNLQVEDVIRRYLAPGLELVELRDMLATLSVQGPKSREILQRLTAHDLSNEAFPYYTFQTGIELAGIPAHVNRMGFTAELGYEVMVPVERGVELWDAIVAAGRDFTVAGCGGDALMIVRTEAGLIMGGLEYDDETTPFECRMGWAVDLEKSFHGRDALRAMGPARRTVVSVVTDGPAEDVDAAVLVDGDAEVGRITMAVTSPYLGGRTLALARVAKGHHLPGTRLRVRTPSGEEIPAEIVETPVYDPQRLKVRS
ncbi:aminomethyltransferase family protein [Agromyces sp. NPDC049794]|uniref:aminomethyltransferase family protein n=1 Tax=unclassified Agromyces TaxID=2639701 RepID=UPI00340A5A48